MSGIRSASTSRTTCLCRYPPLAGRSQVYYGLDLSSTSRGSQQQKLAKHWYTFYSYKKGENRPKTISCYQRWAALFFLGVRFRQNATFFYTSASARSQRFQICQCAKRYSAIAEASARRYPPPRHRLLRDYRIEQNTNTSKPGRWRSPSPSGAGEGVDRGGLIPPPPPIIRLYQIIRLYIRLYIYQIIYTVCSAQRK